MGIVWNSSRVPVMSRCLWIVAGLLLVTVPAHADWTVDMTSQHCSEESRQRVGGISREQIEYAVRRAEASIPPPASVGTLSCLESLMALPLGTFAANEAWQTLFAGTLDLAPNASGTLVRRFCAVAEREWRKVTEPLVTSFPRTGILPPPYRNQKTVRHSSGSMNTGAEAGGGRALAGGVQSEGGREQEGAEGRHLIWQSLTGE